MNAQQTHIASVRDVLAAGSPLVADPARRLIQQSWLRCARDYGLDPGAAGRIRMASRSEMRGSRERSQPFHDVALSGMQALHGHVADLGYVTLLSDAHGITLHSLGEDTLATPVREAGLVTGATWIETESGTNGIGTCLVSGDVVTCHREDHFFAGKLDLSCTAAPLHDPLGQIVGVLDVSALATPEQRQSQHLARHLVALYSRRIEDAYFSRHFRDHWMLRLGLRAPFVEQYAELMLAIDDDGVIRGANTEARRRLRPVDSGTLETASAASLVGHALSAVLRNAFAELRRAATLGADAVVDTWHAQRFHAALSAPQRPREAASVAQARAPEIPAGTAALQALSGGDPAMELMVARATRLAARPIDILIQGETGAGKEVLARALHAASPRADAPFVAINCASIPESLIESELFGYAPGSFTGARSRGQMGLLQRANGGTLFLDEIGDMPLALQTRLLRVLSEREVLPLGAEKPVKVAFTVFAATHRDLEAAVSAGLFREDLYYRLSAAVLELPPLRERQDLAWLIRNLLADEAKALDARPLIHEDAWPLLMRHRWPGNVRELRNAVRYALTLADQDGIDASCLPRTLASSVAPANPRTRPQDAEAPRLAQIRLPVPALPPAAPESEIDAEDADSLLDTLRRHRWNVTGAARALGVSRATVHRRMKRWNIVPPSAWA